MADFDRESMLEMFIFEMSQLVEQLEQTVVQSETEYNTEQINEIFRIMHTIKGSSAMMMFDEIARVAHVIEDLFYYLREESPENIDYQGLSDLVLEGADFVKVELVKIQDGKEADGDPSATTEGIRQFLGKLKNAVGENTGNAPTASSGSPAAGSPASDSPTAKSPVSGSPAGVPVAQAEPPTSLPKEGAPMYTYKAKITFEDGCEMENIRAYTLVHNLMDLAQNIQHIPADVIDEEAIGVIRQNGFFVDFTSSRPYVEVEKHLLGTVYLKELELQEMSGAGSAGGTESGADGYSGTADISGTAGVGGVAGAAGIGGAGAGEQLAAQPYDKDSTALIGTSGIQTGAPDEAAYMDTKTSGINGMDKISQDTDLGTSGPDLTETVMDVPAKSQTAQPAANPDEAKAKSGPAQHVISVNVNKLDALLNLMGELVISEAMVTQNSELDGLQLDSFFKEARQLRKIINNLQETVMSMRMVPLSGTFFKMHRIVRDMCRQLNKDVQLEIIGEDTEVDKNIIEHIADPIMHIIRNSIDHGIEMPSDRDKLGKPTKGKVILQAKHSGSDVLIIIKDDGAGLNKEKILDKARDHGLLRKPESEYTDKEIYQFIFMPGFSTNSEVTAFSGRGVGMDVVTTNLEIVGGTALVDSNPGVGSTFTLKIPLTLAIIEGMTIHMAGAKYTIPIASIKRSFKPKMENVFTDPDGNEMITDRGEIYNIVRLYEFFGIDGAITDLEEGILIQLENGDQFICLLVDDLIGEQQAVVQSMPKYFSKVRGLSGCTLLGNGDISLIIDVAGFFDK